MIVLIVHIAAAVYLTGLIWFVQIVHYPLLQYVPRDAFTEYQQRHQRYTAFALAPPMIVEALTGLLIAMDPPGGLSHQWAWIGLGLLALNWLSTAYVQAPILTRLTQGYEDRLARQLVLTNWIRTAVCSTRTVWVLAALPWVALPAA